MILIAISRCFTRIFMIALLHFLSNCLKIRSIIYEHNIRGPRKWLNLGQFLAIQAPEWSSHVYSSICLCVCLSELPGQTKCDGNPKLAPQEYTLFFRKSDRGTILEKLPYYVDFRKFDRLVF